MILSYCELMSFVLSFAADVEHVVPTLFRHEDGGNHETE
jgi:hypothetical protein